MKVFTEKRSANFLKKKFKIIDSIYITRKEDIKKAVEKIKFPCVVKVFGKKIVHKKKLGGVILDVENPQRVLEIFDRFKKIDGFEGVVVQKQIKGKELLLGIKKTDEFGHVIVVGYGGSNVEKVRDVSFRVCPINRRDAKEMIEEIRFSKELEKIEKKIIVKNLLKLSVLVKKFPKIDELDINPLIIYNRKGIVIDSRIVFQD